ncbi:unnamed protein product, partial [Symbiodinium sp. CCMP2456]
RIQSIVDAYSGAAGSSPDWGNAKIFTCYQSPEDVVAPQLKSWAARKGKAQSQKVLFPLALPVVDVAQVAEDVAWRPQARGPPGWAPQLAKSSPCHALQLSALGLFFTSYEPLAAQGSSGEAALQELLKGRSEYSADGPTTLAPFKLDLISLPASLEGCPDAESLLGEEDCRFLKEQERMLHDNPQLDPNFHPYWEPSLRNNARNYRKLIKRLDDIKYLKYTLYPKEHAGLFFVWKSGGAKTRLIVDARAANRRFKDAPGVQLCTAESFSRFETVDEEAGAHIDSSFTETELPPLHIGLSDVKDAFHRIKQPTWLSRYFCFLPIEARH